MPSEVPSMSKYVNFARLNNNCLFFVTDEETMFREHIVDTVDDLLAASHIAFDEKIVRMTSSMLVNI